MTSLAAGGVRSGPRSRLLWLALGLSLVLNAFLVGTLVWWVNANRLMPPAERFQQIGRELNLNDDQRDAFQQLVIEMRRNGRTLHDSNEPLIEKIWGEMGKPQADLASIDRLVDQATENRRAYQRSMAGALSRFLSSLTPEQRSQFVELTKRHQDMVAARLRHLVTP
jgi:Spy/CpxP family protein refolding chaperone